MLLNSPLLPNKRFLRVWGARRALEIAFVNKSKSSKSQKGSTSGRNKQVGQQERSSGSLRAPPRHTLRGRSGNGVPERWAPTPLSIRSPPVDHFAEKHHFKSTLFITGLCLPILDEPAKFCTTAEQDSAEVIAPLGLVKEQLGSGLTEGIQSYNLSGGNFIHNFLPQPNPKSLKELLFNGG